MKKYKENNAVHKIRVSLLVIVFVLALFLISFEIAIKSYKPEAGEVNYAKISADLAKRIDEIGGEAAYSEFKRAYSDDKYLPVRHTVAHHVGTRLYQKLGLPGVVVCDQSFFYGCFHGFMEMAIYENGTSTAKVLGEYCAQKFGLSALACPHGIGHGILGYVGEQNLIEALDLCESVPHEYPIGGCPEGVFMEYNFTTNHSTGRVITRKINTNGFYAPCDTVARGFIASCYMTQGQWWILSSLENEKVAELCASLSSENLREFCFMGVGRALPDANEYDKKKTLNFCHAMGNYEAHCRAGALITFLASASEDPTNYFCGDLAAQEKIVCLEKTEFLRPVSR